MPQCGPRYSFQAALMPFLYLATPKITILATARAFVKKEGEGENRDWIYVLPSESPWPPSGTLKAKLWEAVAERTQCKGEESWSSRALCRGPREAQTKHINAFEITLGCIYSVLLTTALLWE